MSAIREWKCPQHGVFTSREPVCEHGCDFGIERVFLTPPGTRSAKTKATDNALSRLAGRFGLSDISNRNGSVAASKRGGFAGGPSADDFAPSWGKLPAGGKLEVGKGIVDADKGSGVEGFASQYGLNKQIGQEIMASEENPAVVQLPRVRPNVVANAFDKPSDLQQAMGSAP